MVHETHLVTYHINDVHGCVVDDTYKMWLHAYMTHIQDVAADTHTPCGCIPRALLHLIIICVDDRYVWMRGG